MANKTLWEQGKLRSYGRFRECPICGKMIHSLGWARHRAMHRDNVRKKRGEQK